jgi:hypothetical protein
MYILTDTESAWFTFLSVEWTLPTNSRFISASAPDGNKLKTSRRTANVHLSFRFRRRRHQPSEWELSLDILVTSRHNKNAMLLRTWFNGGVGGRPCRKRNNISWRYFSVCLYPEITPCNVVLIGQSHRRFPFYIQHVRFNKIDS